MKRNLLSVLFMFFLLLSCFNKANAEENASAKGPHLQEISVALQDLNLDQEDISVNVDGNIYKVHALQKQGNRWVAHFSPLTPLDLEWIQEPGFCENIKQSIQQKPYFVGAFYRYLLDKFEELDKIALSKELDKQGFEEKETISQHEKAA